MARRRVVAEKNRTPCFSSRLATKEEGQDAIDGIAPRHDDRPRNLENHDRLLRVARDFENEIIGVVVQAEVGTIDRLPAGCASDDNCHVGNLRGRHSPGNIIRRRGDDFNLRLGRAFRDALQGRNDESSCDVPASTSRVVIADFPFSAPSLSSTLGVVRLRDRGGAHDRDGLDRAGLERKHRFVFQEHNRFRGDFPREVNVLRVGHVGFEQVRAIRRDAPRGAEQVNVVHRGDNAPDCCVHVLGPLFRELFGCEPRHFVPGHLLVQTFVKACRLGGPPVRLNETAKIHPLLHRLKVLLVGARKLPVYSVVGAHESVHARIDRRLERRVIQIPGSLAIYLRRLCTEPTPVGLLPVENPVLHD
mmetsp:Transcript_41652/g.114922  ORF Transcript_41652/g.114922 Transcript_41652/m.114922 type:complete len:361 (+) Transcript_41652:783-1865(+)